MNPDIKIEDHQSRDVLRVTAETSLLKIPKALGENYGKITEVIKAAGQDSAGAPYARYLDIDWQAMRNRGLLSLIWHLFTQKQRMEIGIPVSADLSGSGEIQAGRIEGGRYITTIHRGPYHKVDQTYKKVAQWAEDNNVRMADNTIENYINDPTEVTAEEIETLIMIPVLD